MCSVSCHLCTSSSCFACRARLKSRSRASSSSTIFFRLLSYDLNRCARACFKRSFASSASRRRGSRSSSYAWFSSWNLRAATIISKESEYHRRQTKHKTAPASGLFGFCKSTRSYVVRAQAVPTEDNIRTLSGWTLRDRWRYAVLISCSVDSSLTSRSS